MTKTNEMLKKLCNTVWKKATCANWKNKYYISVIKDNYGDYNVYFNKVSPNNSSDIINEEIFSIELFRSLFGNIDLEWYEYKEPILDKAEKRYLENLLRPFKDKVTYIEKKGCYRFDKENLCIHLDNFFQFELPDFKSDSMYKGMKYWHEYTIEELELYA